MFRSMAITAGLVCCTTLSMNAQRSDAYTEGPKPVSIIVRAESKGGAPTLQPSDLKLEFNGKTVPVSSLQALSVGNKPGVRTEVALLIDDGLRSNFGIQLHEVESFVKNTVSPTTAVGVGYMRNGGVNFPQGFSTEAEQELKAIRLPISMAGVDGSPYFCLQDLVKKWPVHPGVARVVLMITSGIDRYNGSVSPMNQDSPYVAQAITDAQRAGVPVYSIYYGRREVNGNLASFSGQSYLSQTAEGTGGESLNGGTINPVSLEPYFRKFDSELRESYLVTFQTGSTKLQRVKVSSNTKGVKLRAQQLAGAAGAR
ncbi:hypothetical protein Terro_2667 [Terriglobus roseus DSM 18391]|uniref:VWFA-related domain-containing protein n=1 Tax=Terriglobus roseus (strain DSM 18391 / NRRL B-41598 / KBS 63) TaxID=926566 RepID=I3ZI37_TERRK|nr:hypothetical protein [Terriglobus roseus]AFL88564.1 hypothetical protein Terro_2303 [Terriglobus roseus DSM 18391]AFL88905.1 hypothetical protein Terro_2667 [Terriglobus roseus DSM 18391]